MKRLVCVYGTHSDLYDRLNDRAKAYAAEKNVDYEWIPVEPFTREAAIAALKDADAGIIDVQPYDGAIFSQIRDRCKLVIRYGVGFDAVNLADATENGIAVSRTTAANAEAVAEMAFTMIMAAKRQLTLNRRVVSSGVWERNVGSEMLGKKVGILGFGNIGRRLAKLFSGWDCRIYAYDPYLSEDQCQAAGAKKADLDTIFRECDAVSVHLPYTKETHHVVNADRLALMKETAVLVCTARGNIVDEEALAEALKEHRILGAGLDVFAREPLSADSPLIGLDNLILTPHVSAQTQEALWNMYAKAIDVAAAFFNGEDLGRDLLNPDVKKK
jgi:D-3-phosphoglycerate dehydrogenase